MASCSSSPSNAAMQLQDLLGEWRDSMGNLVRVTVAESERFNQMGKLDVELLRSRSTGKPAIRLNVQELDHDKFQCGHFELKLDKSTVDKMVWVDMRIKGKVSVWERGRQRERARSRSRSRSRGTNRCRCGCIFIGKVALHCIDHVPRSVLHDISTPGAWTPLSMESFQILQQPSETKPSLEAYDQFLMKTSTTADLPQQQSPEDILHEERARLLARHSLMADSSEASQAKLHETMSSSTVQPKIARVGETDAADALSEAKAKLLIKLQGKFVPLAPKDPRVRHAPIGGA